MSERWLTLLNGLTKCLLEDPGLLEDPHRVIEEFVEEGYQLKEVEIALAFIGRFVAEPSYGVTWNSEQISSSGLRSRSAEEQFSFSAEAFGYLLRLENSGLIDPSLREEILERALETFEDEIGEEEIKTVSRMVLQDHGVATLKSESDPLDLLENPRNRNLN